ncbi:MAG: hypothetical protein HYX25_03600 [Candidatus Solibacter usitatus]|nr:hypothetical protein [Candidatus Solibacter usitatus]
MPTLRLTAPLAAVFAALALVSSARATAPVVFSDADFIDSDWDTVILTGKGGGTSTVKQVAADGHPGSFRQIDITVSKGAGSIVWSVSLRKSALYNPSVSGALYAITHTEDSKNLSGSPIQASGPALRQNGKIYVHNVLITTAAWSTLTDPNVLASQFAELEDANGFPIQTSHPDFSEHGGEIEFGFFRANSTGGNGYSTHVGIDNWSMTLVATRTISHIADGAGFRTTFILLNTDVNPANFTLNFWSDAGAPLTLDLVADGVTASLSGTIPPHGARFIRTAGATADLNRGWAQLNAPLAVDGNSIFGLQSPGHGDSEAAVPLSAGGNTDLFLPFDNTPGFATGVAFADPGLQAATIGGSFLDDSGSPVSGTNTVSVAAHGHQADVLAALFPGTHSKRGAAHFSAATHIFGLGIRANGKAFTSIEALSGVTASQKIIAHIASGGGWKTTFLLVNTGADEAQFTLDFFSDAGTALALPLDTGATVSTLTATIPAGGLRVVIATNSGSLATGWARLSVTGPISGTAIFGLETAGQSDSEAAVPLALDSDGSKQLYMPFDYTTGYSTGIAIMHSGPSILTTVTITLFDDEGHGLAAPAVVTIPAFGHKSVVLGDLFPGIAGKRGTVSLSADHNIFGLGIRADGFAFTSLKVVTQ